MPAAVKAPAITATPLKNSVHWRRKVLLKPMAMMSARMLKRATGHPAFISCRTCDAVSPQRAPRAADFPEPTYLQAKGFFIMSRRR